MTSRTRDNGQVTIQYATSRRGIPAAGRLRRWALAALGPVRGAVTLRIVAGAESARLNRRYRGRPGATNVLSFPAAPLPDGSRPLIGDIVIAAPVVAREAAAQGKAPTAHWAHMVVHGCLHLLGYDHEQGTDAAEMENRERRVLARLGFADPYRPGVAGSKRAAIRHRRTAVGTSPERSTAKAGKPR